jgi:hypothetical protein
MGEPVELEVLVVRGEFVELSDDTGPAHRLLTGLEQEGGDDIERHRGHDAQRAEANPGRVEQAGTGPARKAQPAGREPGRAGQHAAVREDQFEARDLRGHAADVTSGAVRAGLGRPGHGLHLDVAHVGQRQAVGQQFGIEHVQRAAGLDGDGAVFCVDRPDRGKPGRAQLNSVAHGGGGKGVPRAGHPDLQAVLGSPPDLSGNFLGGGRNGEPPRAGRDVARPVLPLGRLVRRAMTAHRPIVPLTPQPSRAARVSQPGRVRSVSPTISEIAHPVPMGPMRRPC